MNKIKINLNDKEKIQNFIQAAITFKSDIDIISGSQVYDAKSVLGVFNLDFSKDTYVQMISYDEQEISKFKEVMEEFR